MVVVVAVLVYDVHLLLVVQVLVLLNLTIIQRYHRQSTDAAGCTCFAALGQMNYQKIQETMLVFQVKHQQHCFERAFTS